MGFALQLFSNGASRLVYMYLLSILNQLGIDYANPHATLLANTNALCALFSLNAYQYYIARKPDTHTGLISCQTQFKVLLTVWLASVGLIVTGSGSAMGNQVLQTMVAALALAMPELTFTMATARDKAWKSILFYGGQAVFFGCYTLAVIQRQNPTNAALYASVPTVLINLLAYKALQSQKPGPPLAVALCRLGQECRVRLGTLSASLPWIATPSAMIYGLHLHAESAVQIPQMLLFSSLVGAVVFVMGNFMQHYGKDLIPRLLDVQRHRRHKTLFVLILGVFAICMGLTIPADLLLSYVHQNFDHDQARDWHVYAAVTATGAVIMQWYTVVCIHHGHTASMLRANLAYFLMASALASTTLFTNIHVFAVLAICSTLRSMMNIAEFAAANKQPWRT